MDAWLLDAASSDTNLVSSLLLETELRRFAIRHQLKQASVTTVLDGISLAELPQSLFLEAGLFAEPNLRTLDALHLASAIRLEVDELVTYDVRMAEAARELGLHATVPTAD